MSAVTTRLFNHTFTKLAVVAAIVFASLFFYLGENKLNVRIVPYGDFAADLLMKQKIIDEGYLLTGHYSRFEFNHPGPFFFYGDYLFDISMASLNKPRSASVFASIMALNGFFLVLSSLLAGKIFEKRVRFWPLLGSALVIIGYLGNDLHSFWMPHRVILPYLAFFMTLILLARRELIYFPLACLLAAILVHGYLSMVVLALPFVFIFGYLGLRENPDPLQQSEKYLIGLGLVIGLLFASPILIDVLINDSSNIGKIIEQFLDEDHDSEKIVEILQVGNNEIVRGFLTVHLIIMLLGSYILMSSEKGAAVWKYALLTASILIVTFLVYHKNVPEPIYDSMVYFSRAIPLALVIICLNAAFFLSREQPAQSTAQQWFIMVFLMVLSIVSVLHLRPVIVLSEENAHIVELATEIRNRTQPDGYASIGLENKSHWAELAALLYELAQQGYPACSTLQDLAFVYTQARTCSEDQAANIKLTPMSSCQKNACNFVAGQYGLRVSLLESDTR